MIGAIVALFVAFVVIAAALLMFAPVFETLAPVASESEAVQDHGYGSLVDWIHQAGIEYVAVVFVLGVIVIGVIHVLRQELLVTR